MTASASAGFRFGLLAAVAAGLLFATPAIANPDLDHDEQLDRLEEIPDRLDRALSEMLDRMRPALEEMFDLIGVMDQIDSPSNYGKPRILPNGDILIPREPDAPDWPPEEPEFEPKEPLRKKLDPDDATRI